MFFRHSLFFQSLLPQKQQASAKNDEAQQKKRDWNMKMQHNHLKLPDTV